MAKIAEFQQAALMSTIEDVVTLEKQNAQLKQNLLIALRTMARQTDSAALNAKCAHISGCLGEQPKYR